MRRIAGLMARCPEDVSWSDLSRRERALVAALTVGVALLLSVRS